MVPINLVAVLVAAIVAFVLGSIWYGPLFGKPWMRLMGIQKPDVMTPEMKSKMISSYVIMFVTTLVMAYVLAGAIIFASAYLNISGLDMGIIAGVMNWLGFVMPVSLSVVLWEQKPWKLWFIQSGYYLVSLVLMGIVLALWQ